MQSYEYLLLNIDTIKGIGSKTAKLFKKKNIITIFDLLWNLPLNFIDRTDEKKINQLQIGKIQTIRLVVKKYNFPRIRNLPNRVLCQDETGRLDCIFFNSYEGYIKKILPLNKEIIISGKVGYYKGRYQITNPTHASANPNSIKKIFSTYRLTEGLNQKIYTKTINEVLKKLPDLKEWHSKRILNKFDNMSWKNSVLEMHNPKNIKKKGPYLNRLIFDEILSNFLINSKIRSKIKKIKKNVKKIDQNIFLNIQKKLEYKLTNDQMNAINDINKDLNSDQKMFRLLQGDVGSGKTIVAMITCANVISNKYQASIMAPTEILAIQHYNFAKKLFGQNIVVEILTSKTEKSKRKEVLENLKKKKRLI